jgi:8-oxo-dGTP pyrophosphatase MutT (NUDIX family)
MTHAALPPELARMLGRDGVVQRVRLAAHAWCEQGGAVLLTRISVNGPGGGLWTLPGGGLDLGEDPRDGVIREVAEETGLDAVPGDLLGVRSAVLEPAGQAGRGDRAAVARPWAAAQATPPWPRRRRPCALHKQEVSRLGYIARHA